MTTADLFDIILALFNDNDDVRRITADEDGVRVVVCAGVYYNNAMAGHFTAKTAEMFRRIETALAVHGLRHYDSEMDDSDAGDCDAVEVWSFARA